MEVLKIYKENLKKILLLAAMILLPIYVIREFVIQSFVPKGMAVDDPRTIWYLLSVWLVDLFLLVFRIAVIKLSFDTMDGKSTGIQDAMDFSVRLWPKLMLTAVLFGISIVFGLMIFVFPAILLFVSYTFYQYVSVKTGLWGRKSLFLSSLYSKKNIGKAAFIAFGSAFLQYILSLAISTVNQELLPNAVARPLLRVALSIVADLLICVVDIYISHYINSVNLEFDISILQKPKNAENAKH